MAFFSVHYLDLFRLGRRIPRPDYKKGNYLLAYESFLKTAMRMLQRQIIVQTIQIIDSIDSSFLFDLNAWHNSIFPRRERDQVTNDRLFTRNFHKFFYFLVVPHSCKLFKPFSNAGGIIPITLILQLLIINVNAIPDQWPDGILLGFG